jgi:hypothetical protein
MMKLRRLGQLAPGSLLLVFALSALAACTDGAETEDRDLGSAKGNDNDQDDDDDKAGDDSDEPSSDEQPEEDAGRASTSKRDGGGTSTRVDASTPAARSDASAADAGKSGNPSDAAVGEPVGSDSGTADAATTGEPRADLGKGDGKDVITIGDSWMLLLGTGIQESLVRTSGQPYRKYARPGTRLLDGVIPGQYASAKRADPDIKTVVMTGGGNDIIMNSTLKSDCMQGGTMCDAQVEKIRTALNDMWKQMSADGVQDVIHVMYSSSAGSGVKNRDAHNMRMAEVCAAVPAPLRCHLLNTDMLIGPSDMRSDGIHPTDSGYDKIGKAVFALMEMKGMRR